MKERETAFELLRAISERKGEDYGNEEDSLANLTGAQGYGIPNWIGCSLRLADKEFRLRQAAAGGELANESVFDSLLDAANYAVIRLILFMRDEFGPDWYQAIMRHQDRTMYLDSIERTFRGQSQLAIPESTNPKETDNVK